MALQDVIAEHTDLGPAEADHLASLAAEWQLLADLAFADLLLLCRSRTPDRLVVVALMRPYTAQTLHEDDQVGRLLTDVDAPFTSQALAEGRIVREGDPVWRGATPVRVQAIPVRFDGRVIGAISEQQNLATARTPSRLEMAYLRSAEDLARMIADGTFPFGAGQPDPEAMPRVGDGLMRLDASGRIEFASPNAVSAYRGLGVTENLLDRPLPDVDLRPAPVLAAMTGGRPMEDEVEARGTVVLRRVIPLLAGTAPTGALLLLRDVTQLRNRDRMLQLKDATIREVHHRVKNNLQTVASLLRLQGRRLSSEEARQALEESGRRIRAIALVHETLSLERGDAVDLDRVVAQVVAMVREGIAGPAIEMTTEGAAGSVRPEVATPLSVVVAELLQNCVDHAFDERGGRVAVRLSRGDGRVDVEVADDGRGLAGQVQDGASSGLGLQLVRTLVESELGGELSLASDGGGTLVRLSVPLQR